MVPFKTFEHTADVGIEVEAADLSALFADAARGLFAVVRADNPVAAAARHEVDVAADRLDRLLVAFLEEFVFLQDAEGLVFRDVADVAVTGGDGAWHAHAVVLGEPFTHERHPGCLHVKAITRHTLSVTPPQGDSPATARVILDI